MRSPPLSPGQTTLGPSATPQRSRFLALSSVLLLFALTQANYCPCSEWSQNEHSAQGAASPSAMYKGTVASMVLLAILFLMQTRRSLFFLASSVHCWLMFRWLLTSSTSSSYSAGQSSSHSSPSLYNCMGLLWSKLSVTCYVMAVMMICFMTFPGTEGISLWFLLPTRPFLIN